MTSNLCLDCGDSGWYLETLIDYDTGLINSRDRECDRCQDRQVAVPDQRVSATADVWAA